MISSQGIRKCLISSNGKGLQKKQHQIMVQRAELSMPSPASSSGVSLLFGGTINRKCSTVSRQMVRGRVVNRNSRNICQHLRQKQQQQCQRRKFSSNQESRREKATWVGATNVSSETNLFHRFRDRINDFLNQPRTVPIPRWISPQHSTITLSECFGHSSFILVAISYAVDDFLQLRILAIAGSTAMLFFTYFHPHGRVLWLPFKWNVLFIAINSYRVGKVYLDRYFAQQLPQILHDLHEEHFYVMDPVDFARLVRLGVVEKFTKGQVVVKQHEFNPNVRLVVSGELDVQRDGQVTYQLEEGNFISENGLHAGLLLRGEVESCASVVARTDDVVLVRWNRTELMHLLEIDKSILRALKAVLSWDIVSKLKSQRLMLSSGLVLNPEQWTKLRSDQTKHRYGAILHNMLSHPEYLQQRKEELSKYRQIHHIDDITHEAALKEVGWTLEEYETGFKVGHENLDETTKYDWRWYGKEIYYRIFG